MINMNLKFVYLILFGLLLIFVASKHVILCLTPTLDFYFVIFIFEMVCLTEREGDLVTHAEELGETEDALLRVQSQLCHPSYSVANRVLVVARHHNPHFLWVLTRILERLDASETLVQHAVVHGRGRLVVRVDRILKISI